MRPYWMGLVFALAVACDSSDKDPSDEVPTDTESGETDPTDTEDSEVEVEDADEDGFTVERGDCDDEDPDINPAATDICDEIDNDCDDLVDEFYDRDEDGYLDAVDCEHGDDCDDYDSEVNPGEEEVPYDGEDQDCSGSDLTDVDGDGYDSEEVGGEDCDDEDADINPDAEDIAKDGVDQDCSGRDNTDGDGDGYNDEEYGGEDCDDEDPEVRPDRYDFWNDGEDVNCDNKDSNELDLEDATISVVGTLGSQEWLGYSSTSCDLDEDGYDELIIGANLAVTGYLGQVGIFHGSSELEWSAEMAMSDADTVITGTDGTLGTQLVCADLDGDGHDDLVVTQADVGCGSTLDTAGTAYIFYGDGGGFDASLDDEDADASLEFARGGQIVSGSCYITATPVEPADLDGDGAYELVFRFATATAITDDTQGIYVLPGGATLSGSADLEDEAWLVEADFDPTSVEVVDDLDGDGQADLAVGDAFWYDTSDTGDTGGEYYQGRVALISTSAGAADWRDELLSVIYGNAVGAHVGLGYDLAVCDLDGDGSSELLAGAPFHPSLDEEDLVAGGVYAFSSLDELGETPVDADGQASSMFFGQDEDGLMAQRVFTVADMDSDGVDDVLVWEANENSSGADDSIIWLLSGAGLADADATTDYEEDLVLLAWEAEGAGFLTGYVVTEGDFDGDGAVDLAISAYGYGTTSSPGKVYVYVSSEYN